MSRLIILVILGYFCKNSEAGLCNNQFTVNQLPGSVAQNVIDVLINGAKLMFKGCPRTLPYDPSNVIFYLWNQQNPDTPIVLDQTYPIGLNPSVPTIILIPGWLCSVLDSQVVQIKTAYLKRFNDANIIGIEWIYYSKLLSTTATCYTPIVAKTVAQFICNSGFLGISPDQVHMVGHSMGGQMTGLISQDTNTLCKQRVGRITALDPGGGYFQSFPPERRLDKTDSPIVEVIHTNQNQLGYGGPCGTVDFFPNCGTFQPGCAKFTAESHPSGLLNLTGAYVYCNHMRSLDLMAESINSDGFAAKSCALCGVLQSLGVCAPDMIGQTQSLMGEPCSGNPRSSKYYLMTNSRPPYSKG